MAKFGEIIRTHKIAIVLAVLTALITMFPQVFFRIDQKEIYQGIELLPDSPWSARAREVQDGHPNFGAIYYKDGKDNPYIFQPLGSMVVGYMGQALSLDINDTLLLSRFVLPIVAFLLIYAFVLLISRERFVALASAASLLLADSIMSFYGLSRLLQGLSPESFLRLARPVNPAMIYILLFAFLVSFWLYYKNRDWRWGVTSAVFLGLNFYNYFYSWTYLYAFGGILVLIFLIQRKWRDAFELGGVFAAALAVGVLYVLNLYRVTTHPVYEEASQRSGIVLSHMPLFVGFLVIAVLVVFLLGFPREDRSTFVFGLSLLLAPFVTLNQQILTGKILQEAHYHWFFHKPIGVIFVLITLFYLLQKYGWGSYKKVLAVLIIAVSVGTGAFVQASSYFKDHRDGGDIAIERQRYGAVMDWLNEHAEKEAVVLANDEISHLTVIYTPLNVFYHRAAGYSLTATEKRLLDVLFTFYRFRGVSEKDTLQVFTDERGKISGDIYAIHYRELLGSYEAIPDEKIHSFAEQYKETLKTPAAEWVEDVLQKYEVEYIVWDKKYDPDWNVGRFDFLTKEADFGDIVIYTRK